jgi:hypothetical protein
MCPELVEGHALGDGDHDLLAAWECGGVLASARGSPISAWRNGPSNTLPGAGRSLIRGRSSSQALLNCSRTRWRRPSARASGSRPRWQPRRPPLDHSPERDHRPGSCVARRAGLAGTHLRRSRSRRPPASRDPEMVPRRGPHFHHRQPDRRDRRATHDPGKG